MVVTIAIIAVSLVLFVYWFRYTCLIILSGKQSQDYAKQVASANQLTFLQTHRTLAARPASAGLQSHYALDQLHTSLDRDYRLLTYLLRHIASYAKEQNFEYQLLSIDYRLMSLWYRSIRYVSARLAKLALIEMACILTHMANAMGEHVSFSSKS